MPRNKNNNQEPEPEEIIVLRKTKNSLTTRLSIQNT